MKYKPRPLPHKKRGRKPSPIRRKPRCVPMTDETAETLRTLGDGVLADGIEHLLQEASSADHPTRIVLPGE